MTDSQLQLLLRTCCGVDDHQSIDRGPAGACPWAGGHVTMRWSPDVPVTSGASTNYVAERLPVVVVGDCGSRAPHVRHHHRVIRVWKPTPWSNERGGVGESSSLFLTRSSPSHNPYGTMTMSHNVKSQTPPKSDNDEPRHFQKCSSLTLHANDKHGNFICHGLSSSDFVVAPSQKNSLHCYTRLRENLTPPLPIPPNFHGSDLWLGSQGLAQSQWCSWTFSNKVITKLNNVSYETGYETSRALARHGCHVVLACRSVARAEEAIKRIRAERPQALCTAVPLDLRSLRSVKEFVNTLRGDPRFNRGVDILILNAGVFALPHSLTEDGLETTFQVNYLSQFYLVLLLEEMLAKAAPSRVVFVSSESHRFSTMNASNISKEWLSPGPEQFWSMMAYNDSKLCGVVAARELARRWVTRDICVFSCHPGNMVSSDLSRHWCLYRLLFTLVRPFTKSLEQAASTQVYCASATELSDVSGLYFNNCCRCEPSKSAQDPQLASKLWNVSLDLIASHFSSLDIPDKYRHKR
ncbi:WW domain-containing oxidoreductase [Macrosteles quadrilineatus]|uniref:WW domain-containing oxidoreductase n=1 Tax=Macrosteles quadrilineatus TaxID=74068 RepID=UPI0023E2BB36|nr:WW domain-containing oxidoreductase [Macrosteles quadrilineatus]